MVAVFIPVNHFSIHGFAGYGPNFFTGFSYMQLGKVAKDVNLECEP